MAVKLGFIGVGGIARAHMANLAQIEDADIVAVCDIVKEKVNDVANQVGARPYTDYTQMLDAEKLDGVYVCLIPAAHGRIELDLVSAKLPFFIEKPVNIELAAAKRVARAVAKADLLTAAGYHWRYGPSTLRAKQFLKDREPSLVRGRWIGGMPGVIWWRQKKLCGGQALEQTTHIFDLARYFAGDVKEVFAYAATGQMTDVPRKTVEDSSVMTLKFASGAVGTIQSSCLAGASGYGRIGLDLIGRDWAFELTNGSVTTFENRVREEYAAPAPWATGHGGGDVAFVHALKTGDRSKILSDYADAVKSMAVSLAGLESLKSKKPEKVKA